MTSTQKLVRMTAFYFARRMLMNILLLVLFSGVFIAIVATLGDVDRTFMNTFASILTIGIMIGLIYIGLSTLILWLWGALNGELEDGFVMRHVLQSRAVIVTLIIVPATVLGFAAYIADRTPFADMIDGAAVLTSFFAIVATIMAFRAATQTAKWLETQGLATPPNLAKKKKK